MDVESRLVRIEGTQKTLSSQLAGILTLLERMVKVEEGSKYSQLRVERLEKSDEKKEIQIEMINKSVSAQGTSLKVIGAVATVVAPILSSLIIYYFTVNS